MAKALSFSDIDPGWYQTLLERVAQHPLATHTSRERLERMVEVATQRIESVTVVFENLWNSHNRAAVLRTAEGLGISRVHVVEDETHYRRHRGISHGAERWLEVRRHRSVEEPIEVLREQGFLLCAADVGEDCVALTEVPGDRPMAVLLGSEKEGLSAAARQGADVRFSVPMAGFTGSFNVSVSAAIALWEICSRRREALGQPGDLDLERSYERIVDWLGRNTSTGRRLRNQVAARRRV